MKTRLNIICILIFVAIIGSLVNLFGSLGGSLGDSAREGFEDALKADETNSRRSVTLFVKSEGSILYPDSVYNKATEEYLPIRYSTIDAMVRNDQVNHASSAVAGIMALVVAIAMIVVVVYFIKLVYAINKSVIFEWKNVVKLRIIGISMLIAFAGVAIYGYLSYVRVIANIDLQHYIVEYPSFLNFFLLIAGLGLLLIAEIFAIGLRLKEEQELTI